MAEYNGNEILFNPQLKVGGTDDYNELSNKPVINADLDNTAASTADQTVLYHHVGESTATYKKAALYYTDGTNWLQFKGENGAQGSTGLTALEYNDTHTEEYEGDIADEPISLPISGFNRTPVVGDIFLLVYNMTESGNTYIAPFTITEVATDTAKASLNGANSQNITGDKGADGAQTVTYNGNDIIEVSSVAKGATFSLATSLLTGANTIKVGDSCTLPLQTTTVDGGLKYECQITAISNGTATLKIVDGFPTQSRMVYGGAVSKYVAPITLTLDELLGATFSWGMCLLSINDLSAGTMKIGDVSITEDDGSIIIYRINGFVYIQKQNGAMVYSNNSDITFEGVTSFEFARYSMVFNMNWEL